MSLRRGRIGIIAERELDEGFVLDVAVFLKIEGAEQSRQCRFVGMIFVRKLYPGQAAEVSCRRVTAKRCRAVAVRSGIVRLQAT